MKKTLHYWTGLLLVVFVAVHLANHLVGLSCAEAHIAFMDAARLVYRNIVVETILLVGVALQMGTGVLLVWQMRPFKGKSMLDRLHIFSGLYLALFLAIHVSAVLGGRFLLHLDTNFYFGAAGLNTFPFLLFFVPYYGLAMLSVFVHIACIHYKKTRRCTTPAAAKRQAFVIGGTGVLLMLLILFAMTNGFHGVEIPAAYGVLVGK